MDDSKKKVEVILFTTGRFMTAEEIGSLAGVGSIGLVKEILEELKKEYEAHNSALLIFEDNRKWKMGIKKEFNYLTTRLLSECELDKPTQETLAIIAYKQPMLQSEVVKIRGNTTYDHVKKLRELEFITSEKSGRTRLLKLTPKFFDYFDIVEDQLKAKFSEIKHEN